MNELCTACLCTNRDLYYIGETGFYHLYSQILSEIPVYDLSQICVRICWECRAALKKLQLFKQQVKSCYSEMLEYIQQGQQDTKLLQKLPRLQTKQVITINYPEIKTEYDTLDLEFDDQRPQEYDQFSVQPFEQHGCEIGQDLAEDVEDLEKYVKTEDHNDLKMFAKDLDVKKKDKQKSKVKKRMKVEKVKAPKVKKKTTKLKKEPKPKTKRKKVEKEIKSDAESCQDYEDGYILSPFEEKEDLDYKEDLKEKVEDVPVDKKECDIYEREETETLENVIDRPPPEVRLPRAPRAPRQPREQSTEKPQCAECGKVFSSRKTLRYHLNVLHKGNNRYPCPRCGKVYQWKSNLGRHIRSHKARDTGELYCATCDKFFASVATYRQHLSVSKQHVSESEFSFICNECGKKFVNKTRLRDHIDWEHLQKIKFRCQLCNKPFKCHTSLYVHMKNVHKNKGLKDNLCHVCGKSYQNAAKLRYHIVAMHTTETPYHCEQCSATFGWYSSLYRHVREVHYKMKLQPNRAKKGKKRPPETPLLNPPLLGLQAVPTRDAHTVNTLVL